MVRLKTILIIEDEREIRQLANWVVELEGYRPLEAASGNEGLALLDRHRVDMVLLDLRLPDRDGWSVLREMKRQEKLRSIPVVIFTASAGQVDQETARSLGADGYLIKPLSVEMLKNTITRVLSPGK